MGIVTKMSNFGAPGDQSYDNLNIVYGQLKLTGLNLGRVFNFRSGCM
jgi:hypothetical protein